MRARGKLTIFNQLTHNYIKNDCAVKLLKRKTAVYVKKKMKNNF